MSEKFPSNGGESNEDEVKILNDELQILLDNMDAHRVYLASIKDSKRDADNKELSELKESEKMINGRIKTTKRAIKQKKDLIVQKGGSLEDLGESIESVHETVEASHEVPVQETTEEDVDNIANEIDEMIDARTAESSVDPEVLARVQHRAKSKVGWFSKKYNKFKEGAGKAKEFATTKEGKAVIGKAGYDTATSIWGIKTFSDILLYKKKKGDIYNYFEQKGVRKAEMAQLNELAIDIEKNWQFRLSYANKRKEEAGNNEEDRKLYDIFHEDDKNSYENASNNVRLKLKEFYTIVGGSDNLTAEEKKEYRKKATRIMYERGKKEEPIIEKRDSTVAEATSVYLKTKVHGAKIVKDALNTTLMWTGLVGFRTAGYGLMSIMDRGTSAKREYSKNIDLDYRKLRGVETVESKKEKVKAVIKDLTVNSTVETTRALMGKGKKEGSQHKKMEFVQAMGSVLRIVGIVGKDYDEILESASIFSNSEAIESASNMPANPEKIEPVFASVLSVAEENGIGQVDLDTYSGDPDSLLTYKDGTPINLADTVGIESDSTGVFENDPRNLSEQSVEEDLIDVENPTEELKVDNFNKEHALFLSEGNKDGFDINNEEGGVVSAVIKLGKDGAYSNVDQALRRMVVDNMDISGDFDAIDAAKAENVLANIRELLNGKNVAGMSSANLKGIINLNAEGDLVIEDYNKFSELNDRLFERANDPLNGITDKSDAVAYVDNTGLEKWQAMVNAKLDSETHAVNFNDKVIGDAEMKVFEQQYGNKFSFLGDNPEYKITNEGSGSITINNEVYQIQNGEVVSIDGNKLEMPVKINESFQESLLVQKIGVDYNVSVESLKSIGVVSETDWNINDTDKQYLAVLNSKGLLTEDNIKQFAERGYHVDYFVKDGKFNNEAFELLVDNGGKIDKASFDEMLVIEAALESRVNDIIPLESVYMLQNKGYTFNVAENGDVTINMAKDSGFSGGMIISENNTIQLSSAPDALAHVDSPQIIETQRPINTYINDKDKLGGLFKDLENKQYEHSKLADSMESVVDEGRFSINMDRGYFEALDTVEASSLWSKKEFIDAMMDFGRWQEPQLKSVGQKDNLGKLYDEIIKTIATDTDPDSIRLRFGIIGDEPIREYLMRVVGERELTNEDLTEDKIQENIMNIKDSTVVREESILKSRTSTPSLENNVDIPKSVPQSADTLSDEEIIKDLRDAKMSTPNLSEDIEGISKSVPGVTEENNNLNEFNKDGLQGEVETVTNITEENGVRTTITTETQNVTLSSEALAESHKLSRDLWGGVKSNKISKDDLISRLEEYKGAELDKGDSMAIRSIYRRIDKGGNRNIIKRQFDGLLYQLTVDRAKNINDGVLVLETEIPIASEDLSSVALSSESEPNPIISKELSNSSESLPKLDFQIMDDKTIESIRQLDDATVQVIITPHEIGGDHTVGMRIDQIEKSTQFTNEEKARIFTTLRKAITKNKDIYEPKNYKLIDDLLSVRESRYGISEIGEEVKSELKSVPVEEETEVIAEQLLEAEESKSDVMQNSIEKVVEGVVSEELPKVEALIKGLGEELDKSFQEAGMDDPTKRQKAVEFFMSKLVGEDGKISYKELMKDGLVTEDYQYSDKLAEKLLFKYEDDINEYFKGLDLSETKKPLFDKEGVKMYADQRLVADSAENLNNYIQTKATFSVEGKAAVQKVVNDIADSLKSDPTQHGVLSGNVDNYTYQLVEPNRVGLKMGIRIIEDDLHSAEFKEVVKGDFRADISDYVKNMPVEAKTEVSNLADEITRASVLESSEELEVGIDIPEKPSIADNFNPDGTIKLEIDKENIPDLASSFKNMGDKTKSAWVEDYNRLNHSSHTVSEMEDAISKAARLISQS